MEAELQHGDSAFPIVTVHPLSEHVFCPRAALLALESAQTEQDAEPSLGPKLDWFGDYDEREFVEALRATWGEFRFWLTCLAPALLLILVVGDLAGRVWGAVVSLPAALIAVGATQCALRVIEIVRQRAVRQEAVPYDLDLDSPGIREVNWWSLRKANFECIKPSDKNYDPGERLAGKPWRVLVRNAVRVPVIRKRGSRDHGRQHEIRLAAYCRLLEACEGAQAPFGVLIFAGSYDCLIFPNTPDARAKLSRAVNDYRAFLHFIDGGGRLSEPTDQRCYGCLHGKPRRYLRGRSETVLRGEVLTPFLTPSLTGVQFHCDCGDRFDWVPRHQDAFRLQLVDKG